MVEVMYENSPQNIKKFQKENQILYMPQRAKTSNPEI